MALQQAYQYQENALNATMHRKRLDGISRARWIKTAVWSQKRTDTQLITPYQENEEAFQR